jgi:hypothetical protein
MSSSQASVDIDKVLKELRSVKKSGKNLFTMGHEVVVCSALLWRNLKAQRPNFFQHKY